MKKPNLLFLSLISTAILSSCSCSRSNDGFPANPQNGTRYTDSYGNNCVWNSAMQYWMITSMFKTGPQVNYYYPSTGVYHNSQHQTVSRPSYVAPARTASPSRSFFSGSSKSGGFGSTGRSSSAS